MSGRPAVRTLAFLTAAALPTLATATDPNTGTFVAAVERGHALLREPASVPQPPAAIAIILDDLGEQHAAGLRAAALPGAVACAFLPYGHFTAQHAELAHRRGKEVLLHLPLEPGAARRHPTSLTVRDGREDIGVFVRKALAAVPHVRGVNNHQGSLMTELPRPMNWLMAELRAHPGLYFVDSRTTPRSVAYRAALRHGVPAAERNVFLDNVRDVESVREKFRRLLIQARRNGHALAIAHPYPETFEVLEQELPRLERYGVRLVPPSALTVPRDSGDSPLLAAAVLSAPATPATRTAGPGLP